jgi:hypothetical protein
MLALFTAVIFAASANVITPQWQPSYAKAYTAAATQHKPMAVFLGQGSKPELTTENAKLLNGSYVAVFVDTTTAAGKSLAESFGLSTGLVISDATAGKQALSLSGTVSESDLTVALTRFADKAVATTTETTAAPAPVAPYCPTGRCPFAK